MIEHVEDESKAVGGLTLGADPLVNCTSITLVNTLMQKIQSTVQRVRINHLKVQFYSSRDVTTQVVGNQSSKCWTRFQRNRVMLLEDKKTTKCGKQSN